MKETYTIPEASREAVQKLIARQQKKADLYGIPLSVEWGDPYAKLIPVYSTDGLVQEKVREELHEVFDLTIESEIIRKDGYTVVAKIEHLEGGNVVSTFGCDCLPEWTTMPPHCDHCNGNHGQRVTFIVRHEDGTEKQVGRTCLKDYCGINPQAIGWANELNEILLDEDIDRYDWDEHPIRPALYASNVLALAVMLQRTKGYTASSERMSNKEMLTHLVAEREEAPQQDCDRAKEIEDAIKAMTRDEAFDACLNNVKSLLDCGYCKEGHFGYIAYAPLAFERYQKKLAAKADREAAKSAERAASQYVGEIGQRLTVDAAEITLLTSWEGDWGWTYLYKIVDTQGNVLIWYASKVFGHWVEDEHGVENYEEYKGQMKIKATVKDHSERDGVRQTIITRCSAA